MTTGPRLAYITAGAGGMFCGSCLHDNTLAAGLMRLGCDVRLIPTYTPIRTDEEDVSIDRVFFGGINVYLEQRFALARALPGFLDRWLSWPWLIRWAASSGIETEAAELGAMTLSMLRGERGLQAKEVRRLVDYLEHDAKPELVNLTNLLIGGCVESIKRRLGVPVLVTLQGDDVFLDGLPERDRERVVAEMRRVADRVDGFLVFSRDYAARMGEMLGIDEGRFRIVPLGLRTEDFAAASATTPAGPPTIGYLARICPTKGLDRLVEAFLKVRQMPGTEDARLRIAGWMGETHRPWLDELLERLTREAGPEALDHVGEVDRAEKVDFFHSIDVFSVPATYRDPKGLYVLEALASGVPVVQPDHGAFPELIEQTGGGLLFGAGDADALAERLHGLLIDRDRARRLGAEGRERVLSSFNAASMAEQTLEVLREFLPEAEPTPALV